MDYNEWSQEYYETALLIKDVIDKLKKEKMSSDAFGKKELDLKIAKFRVYYNECLQIANHLKMRCEGVG